MARACCAASGATRSVIAKLTGARFQGSYFTGDGCRHDKDGYFWIVGRIDDVLNVAGHRIGTAEVESALVSNPKVAEAAVVGRPDDLKGQALVAFVTVKSGVSRLTNDCATNCATMSRKEIGPVAKPDDIRFAEALPKTRCGKIMRRLLKGNRRGGRSQRRHHHAGGFQCAGEVEECGGVRWNGRGYQNWRQSRLRQSRLKSRSYVPRVRTRACLRHLKSLDSGCISVLA